MKQFTRTTNLALLSGALLGAASLPSASTAKPFPKRGYILRGKGSADIGRRSSSLDAQRAALRMLARMMLWFPHRETYDVAWEIVDGKGDPEQESLVLRDEGVLNTTKKLKSKLLIIYGSSHEAYGPVTTRVIHQVAHDDGSLLDLKRCNIAKINNVSDYDYSYSDTLWPLNKVVFTKDQFPLLNIGQFRSVAEGDRASLRALARLNKRYPRAFLYAVQWTVRLRPGSLSKLHIYFVRPDFSIRREDHSFPQPKKELKMIGIDGITSSILQDVARRGGGMSDLRKASYDYCNSLNRY